MSKKRVPHDPEAERALICAGLVCNRVMDTVSVDPRDFSLPANDLMWTVMVELSSGGKPLDDVTVPAELQRRGKFHVIGGLDGFREYLNAGGIASRAQAYSDIIRERARARRILEGSADLQLAAWDGAAADDLEDRLHAIGRAAADTTSTCMTIPQLVKARFHELGEAAAALGRGEFLHGVPTGIHTLDNECGGVQFGLATIVAARPGMGKSSFAMEIAAHAAQLDGYDVHVFSLEDTRQMFTDRLLAKLSGVPAAVIRSATITDADMDAITRAVATLVKLHNFRYENVAGISASELVRCVARERRPGRKLLVIADYIQIMTWPKYARDENQAIAQTINTLADGARNNGDAYIVLSQLNRECESRPDKRPLPKDLRASGELEQRAKALWFLYRGSEYGKPVEGIDYHGKGNEPTEYDWRHTVEILVRKNSNGENNLNVKCHWDGPTMRITQRRQGGEA